MKRLQFPAAASALAISLALAAPALAQQALAPAAPAPAAPAAAAPAPAAPATPNEGDGGGQATAADRGQRQVTARDLMTREERSSLRQQMRAATPEARQALWAQKRAELEQRAAQRGLVLAEPGRRSGGNDGKGPGNRAESGRGEGRGSIVMLVTRVPPRAP